MGGFRCTCTGPKPRYLPIRHVNGIGEGRGEGAQARSTDYAYLWLIEMLRDALSEEFETSSKGQLSVGHDNVA